MHLSRRDGHHVMKAITGKPGMAMGKELTRANGDCGVDKVNSIAEGGEEAIEPICRAQMRGRWLAGTRPMAASISTSETVERKTGPLCIVKPMSEPRLLRRPGARVANKEVSMSQVFNAFLSGRISSVL